MVEKKNTEHRERHKNVIIMAFIISFVIVLLDVCSLVIGILKISNIAWCVGSVGIITFFGVLMLANYLSETADLDKGEMRKAIAVSFVAVYFSLVSILSFPGFNPSDSELAKTIIGHFTYLVGIIVVFYFSSSAVRDYLKILEKRKKS